MANAEANWEKLFKQIQETSEIDEYEHYRYGDGFIVVDRYGFIVVDLTDSEADRYDFANEVLMRRMRERLVETLQEVTSRRPSCNLKFGNKFFMTMNEQQQQSFFHSIFILPMTLNQQQQQSFVNSIFKLRVRSITVGEETDDTTESPAISINTSALLETLPQLQASVRYLTVSNFALTRQTDVQALSNIVLAKCRNLECLKLVAIECPVDDCNKQDSNERDGFLDPLFYAASGLEAFCVSTKARSIHSTLVSPRALRALVVEGKRFRRILSLRGLDLTDSHVVALVDVLSTPFTQLRMLNLESNPDITAQGYDALFNLINRANAVGSGLWGDWTAFLVDDKAWEDKLNLVSEMNSQYGRLEYMTNGTFTSEEHRWQWLERVANLPSSDKHSDYAKKKWDARHLNFIWYTLCQNPEMIKT